MEKVILEFDVNTPDGYEEVKEFFMLYDYRAALHEIDNMCRSELKYGTNPVPEHLVKLLENIRHECAIIDGR